MQKQVEIGFFCAVKVFRKLFDEFHWKKCGIIAYKDIIYKSSRMYLDSVFLQLAITKVLREKGVITIPIITDNHEFIQSDYYTTLINLLLKEKFFPLYFGGETRVPDSVASFPHVTLSVSWIENNKEKVAKITESLCLVQREISPDDIDTSSLSTLGNFFIKALGPPSLSEQLKQEFVGDKLQLTLDAISAASAFINPYALIGTTVKAVWRTFRVLLKRRSIEIKKEFEEWTKNLKKFFSEKQLSKLLTPDIPEEIINKILSENVVILSDAVRTPYEVFLVMLIEQLYEKLKEHGEKPFIFLIDNSHTLLRSNYFRQLLLSSEIPIVNYLQTEGLPLKEDYIHFAEEFMKEKAIIFDIAAEYFEHAIKGLPFSTRAMLLQFFAKIEKTRKGIAFIHFDAKKGWSFKKISEPLLPWLPWLSF